MNISTNTVAFKWEGVPQMMQLFAQMAELIGPDGMGTARDQLKDALMIPAMTIRDEAKDLVPVRTGLLKSAIYAGKGPVDKPGVIVAVDLRVAFYGGFVELGTSKASPHPYFRPAVTATRPLVANMIADDLKKLIEGMANQLAYHPPL